MERQESKPEILNQIIAAQERIIVESGLWSTTSLRQKYEFRLSPDALCLSASQRREMENICGFLYQKDGFFEGSMKLYRLSLDQRFASTHVGGTIKRALTAGIPKREIPFQGIVPDAPLFSRVDLMETNDGKPAFMSAEIEGDKAHGFGYLTLVDSFKEMFFGVRDTEGIIEIINKRMSEKGIDPEDPVIAIVGKAERFYLGEMNMFSGFCRRKNVNLYVVPEDEVQINQNGIFASGVPESRILLNMPSLTPAGFGGTQIDEARIYNSIASRQIECLIPPNRFLGSKSLLALVSNGDDNQDLESVLRECFNADALEGLRTMIPQTILITKKNRKLISTILADDPGEWVIKKVISSGMKGVALPSDKEKLADFVDEATASPFNYVVQRKVSQRTERFRFSEPGSLSMNSAQMYMRIELLASPSGLASVGVTAREEPSVHGARDAIQIPVIFNQTW